MELDSRNYLLSNFYMASSDEEKNAVLLGEEKTSGATIKSVQLYASRKWKKRLENLSPIKYSNFYPLVSGSAFDMII